MNYRVVMTACLLAVDVIQEVQQSRPLRLPFLPQCLDLMPTHQNEGNDHHEPCLTPVAWCRLNAAALRSPRASLAVGREVGVIALEIANHVRYQLSLSKPPCPNFFRELVTTCL